MSDEEEMMKNKRYLYRGSVNDLNGFEVEADGTEAIVAANHGAQGICHFLNMVDSF